jgi:hypothetical protein
MHNCETKGIKIGTFITKIAVENYLLPDGHTKRAKDAFN